MPESRNPARRIGQIIFPGAQILDITGPTEVFAQAGNCLDLSDAPRPYEISLIAESPGPVPMSSGLRLCADLGFGQAAEMGFHTVMVPGGAGVYRARENPKLIRFIKEQYRRTPRTASVCTGTFILAEAGILEGRQVTTHWSAAERLAAEYPGLGVDPDRIFIRDGRIYSSAGVTAGIDLALALVQEDHGRKLALAVARQLVVFMKRQGGQSQFSTCLLRQSAGNGRLAPVLQWMARHPRADLSVEALARQAAMSRRNFARAFKRQTGMSPGKFVEKMRVEKAARRIETRDTGFGEIARDSGFKNEETMRRAFKRQLNVLPQLYRKRFGY